MTGRELRQTILAKGGSGENGGLLERIRRLMRAANSRRGAEWRRTATHSLRPRHSSLQKEMAGGAGGIRTLDTLLAYTHFPGERLRPLGHRSACTGSRVL